MCPHTSSRRARALTPPHQTASSHRTRPADQRRGGAVPALHFAAGRAAAPQAQGCRAGVHYHRLNAVLDAKHLKLDEGGDAPLRDLRLLALDQVGSDDVSLKDRVA